MDGHFQVEAALEARTDFIWCGSVKAEHIPWRHHNSFVRRTQPRRTQLRRGICASANLARKVEKTPEAAHDYSKRLLPAALNALPMGSLLNQGIKLSDH
jgi:hypothetical protein